MSNYINAPRYQQWFLQQQTALTSFNISGSSSSGNWNSASAQMLRVDAGSVTATRDAAYSRFPVLTGTKSEVAGIRGRKRATWSIRGLPLIPSGSAATAPDCDAILQNIFGAVSSGSPKTYAFTDSGYLPFSLIGFNLLSTTLTQRALWGCFVTRATFNFDGLFLTVDLDGFAGYVIDSTGFSSFPADGGLGGLTAFPTRPSTPTINGSPIPGFGNGYSLTLHSQTFLLSVRALSLTIETGFTPIDDVYDSPYLAQVVGGARRISIAVGDILDSDYSTLTDLKQQADIDTTSATAISGTIVAGNSTGNTFTFNLKTIQPNAFNLRDNGNAVAFELPASFAHASTIGAVDDFTMAYS